MDKRTLQAVAVQSAGSAYNAIVSFVLLAWLARTLGPQRFGEYVALVSAAVVALILIEAGWPTRIVRESVGVRADARDGVLWRLTGTAVTHVLVAAPGLACIALAFGFDAPAAALACMGGVALANLVSARLRGAGRFLHDALWQSSVRTASALAIAGTAACISDAPRSLFAAWLTATLFMLALTGRRFLAMPRGVGWLASYAAVAPFVVIEGGMALLMKGDVALVSLLGIGAGELADYAACTRLTEAALLLFAPVANVLLPALRAVRHEPARFDRLLGATVIAALAFGLVFFAATLVVGDRLVQLFFGDAFLSGGALLPWVAVSLPLTCTNIALAAALVALDRERALAVSLAMAAVAFVAGAWLGLETGGARGAAVGVAFGQVVMLLCTGTAFWRHR